MMISLLIFVENTTERGITLDKHEKLKYVRHVAVYVRKSRGDSEADLDKHLRDLVRFCEEKDWTYVVYKEIGTADTIIDRPVMLKVLEDINDNMYDALVGVHIDRISRGDTEDRGLLQKTLRINEVLLITLNDVYDMEDESSVMQAELQGIMAKMELNAIKRRFRAGKVRAVKDGFWVYGSPPFPYEKNNKTKKVEINQEQLAIYRRMIEMLFDGYTTSDIAWEINKIGVKTNTGGMWSGNAVARILTSEIHLGRMVVNKTKTNKKDKKKRIPIEKDKWITYHNCHEAVKTESEHDKIIYLIKRNLSTPVASRGGKSKFSSLIHCHYCGRSLVVQKHKTRKGDTVRACVNKDPFGNKCPNYGGSASLLQEEINKALLSKKEEIEKQIAEGFTDSNEVEQLEKIMSVKHGELKVEEKALSKIYRNHELNLYSSNDDENDRVFLERRTETENKISTLEEEYNLLHKKLERAKDTKNEDLLGNIEEVIELLNNPDVDVRMANRAYKTIINRIEWERKDLVTEPTVYVNFL